MSNFPIDEKNLAKFGPYTMIIGILLILLGAAGILLPGAMSVGTAIFVTWMLIVGGVFWAVHTFKYTPKSVMDWLKPVLLLISGGLMLFSPESGVAAVGLMLAIYLLLHGFASFANAQSLHPAKGWGWMVFNGITSVLLAILFLIGWPVTSLWLVGLYVGITLLFDGWALLAIGWALDKRKKA